MEHQLPEPSCDVEQSFGIHNCHSSTGTNGFTLYRRRRRDIVVGYKVGVFLSSRVSLLLPAKCLLMNFVVVWGVLFYHRALSPVPYLAPAALST